MRSLLIGLIQLYRWFLSPLLGPNCRFHPTCSCYAQDSIRRHGAVHGAWLAIRRIVSLRIARSVVSCARSL